MYLFEDFTFLVKIDIFWFLGDKIDDSIICIYTTSLHEQSVTQGQFLIGV